MAPYSVFLAVLSAVFAPAVTNNFALAQTVGGCTTNSFTTPSWLVQDFHYSETSRSSWSYGNASFRVLNRATNASAVLTCRSSNGTVKTGQASGGWRHCGTKNEKIADKFLTAYLQLNGTTARFLVNETWTCSDISDKRYDITHPFPNLEDSESLRK